jgi:hypothetical protein
MFARIEIFGIPGDQPEMVLQCQGGLEGVGKFPPKAFAEIGGFFGYRGINGKNPKLFQQRPGLTGRLFIQADQYFGQGNHRLFKQAPGVRMARERVRECIGSG